MKGLLLPLVLGASLVVACGPAEDLTQAAPTARQGQPLVTAGPAPGPEKVSANGFALNGFALNGLALNGFALNGFALNGLTSDTLGTADFTQWFQENPALHEMQMRYIARCGLAEGRSLDYTDAGTGVAYAWPGQMGLTPEWARGKALGEAEQQLITACLAAHANKYGMHIPISVLGQSSEQKEIAFTREELETFSRPEACFFGNLFGGEGIYVGTDGSALSTAESTARACALSSHPESTSSECPPLIHVGSCENVCVRQGNKPYFTSCTLNGRTYLPITTRLRPEEIYSCGDGVCQFTERPGTGDTWDSCRADCGT